MLVCVCGEGVCVCYGALILKEKSVINKELSKQKRKQLFKRTKL